MDADWSRRRLTVRLPFEHSEAPPLIQGRKLRPSYVPLYLSTQPIIVEDEVETGDWSQVETGERDDDGVD